MEISALEKELDVINRKYVQSKPPTLPASTGKTSVTTAEQTDRSITTRPFNEKGSLKDYSNEELEKLIELKNQSLEKLHAHNLYPPPMKTNQSFENLPSALPIANPNINSILNKYNISPTLDPRKLGGSKEVSFNQELADSILQSNNVSFNQGNERESILKDISMRKSSNLSASLGATHGRFDSINSTPNPYLNNLSSGQMETKRDIGSALKSTNDSGRKGSHVTWDNPPRTSIDAFANQSTPSKGLPPQDSYRNSNKENYSSALQLTPTTKARGEASSQAIAGAMKALQDKLKLTESEMSEMKKAVDNHEKIKQDALNDQRRKFEHELNLGKERENHLQRNVDKLHDENQKLREEISRLQGTILRHEEDMNNYKLQISKFKDELNNGYQERVLLQKEIDMIENEKNTHLEQNVLDKDGFERKVDELLGQLDVEREKHKRLENEKKDLFNAKLEAEAQLDKVIDQTSTIERRCKESMAEMEDKFEHVLSQNQAYQEELMRVESMYEQERGILKKKLEDAEVKVNNIADTYEEKIKSLKSENKEFKNVVKSQKEDLETLKKKFSTLEKSKDTWSKERTDKEDLIRQLTEFNDELLEKFKKDTGNPQFKGLWYKKKKIEDKMSKVERETKSARRESSVKKKKTKSRSPSAKKLKKKSSQSKLHVEDLNISVESRSGRRDSAKKLSRNPSESQGSIHMANSFAIESKHSTPRRNIPTSASKKSILKSVEKGDRDRSDRDRSYENLRGSETGNKSARKSSMTDNDIRNSIGQRISIQSLLTPNESSSSKMYGLPDFKITPKTLIDDSFSVIHKDSSNLNSGIISRVASNQQVGQSTHITHSGPSATEISRMTSDQVSKEIVKIEREIAELKREYKNLLAKTQGEQSMDDISETRSRMNFVASELQNKTETHHLLKKKQREILAKNL